MAERILRFRCGECDTEFMVGETEVDDLPVCCPICGTQVEVDDDPEGEEEELNEDDS